MVDRGSPAGAIVLLPFAAGRELISSGYPLPIFSGALGGAALAAFGRTLAGAGMDAARRLPIIVATGLNPVFAFAAMNGSGDALYLAAAAVALLLIQRSLDDGDGALLPHAGTALAIGSLARFELVLWGAVAAVVLPRGRERGAGFAPRQRRSLVLRPALAVAAWVVVAAALGAGPGASLGFDDAAASEFSATGAATDLARAQLAFPLVPAVLIALAVGGLGRAAVPRLIASLIAVSIAASWTFAAVAGSDLAIELGDALALVPVAIAGAAWLYRSSSTLRTVTSAALLVLAVAAIPSAWAQMRSFPSQDAELAFTRALATGEDQGHLARGPGAPSPDEADQILGLLDHEQLAAGEVLSDEAAAVPLVALSGRPEVYLTPAEGDAAWERALAAPVGRVRFAVARLDGPDRILERHPGARTADTTHLGRVFVGDRYLVLRVTAPE